MTDPQGSTDSHVDAALDRAFPDRDVQAISPGGISWNDGNETVRVDFRDGDAAYLKVAVDGDASRIVRERAAIEYVDAHCEVSVPTVVASDPDAAPPYLATAPMAEPNLAERWEEASTERRVREVRAVGAAFAEIHSQSFERHGRIVGGDGDALRLDAGTWTDVLVEEIESIRARASTDRFDAYFDEAIAVVEDSRAELDDAPARLLHGDPAQPNLCYDGATVGFLDWELAHVGDPLRELTRVEHQPMERDADALLPAFRAGYRDRLGADPPADETRRAVYDAIWHLERLGAFEKEVERADEPPEAVAAAMAEEMERLLATVRSEG